MAISIGYLAIGGNLDWLTQFYFSAAWHYSTCKVPQMDNMVTNVPLKSLILSPGIAHCLCSIMISDTLGMGIYGICIRCQQLGSCLLD